MERFATQLIGCRKKCIGLSLQLATASLGDLTCPFCQPGKERIDSRAYLGLCAKADVCGDILSYPRIRCLFR
jgi:hypothetical protein